MTPEEVQRLEKAELDLAVARAKGKDIVLFPDNKFGIKVYNRKGVWVDIDHYSPSTCWAQGGPLIEEFTHGVEIDFDPFVISPRRWSVSVFDAFGDEINITGSTLLEAACRAYVLAKGE